VARGVEGSEEKGKVMNIEIKEMEERRAKIIVSNTTPSIVNLLRRAMIADVPKMAIEDVEFHLGPIRDEHGNEYESAAPLFDEIIAHRLGLVPIPTDLNLFTFRDQCSCGGVGCPQCTIIYSLSKKGPCTVYSGDLEPVGDPSLAPVDKNIPIVKLGEGQALLIYAIAVLGRGKEHAKWQAAQAVGYKYYPEINIDTKLCDLCMECAQSCPVNILKSDGKKIIVEDNEKCTLCNTCVEVCAPNAIKVIGRDDKFILTYETDGALKAYDVLIYALRILRDRFSEIEKSLDSIK